MNRYQLESRIKSVGIAYVLLFICGAHYAYLNQWKKQILFWITFCGFGIWWLIDVFTLHEKVDRYNAVIFDELDRLDSYENGDYEDDFSDLRRRHSERSRSERQRGERSGNLLEEPEYRRYR